MPIKKTTIKKATAKKPVAKKVVAKKATNKFATKKVVTKKVTVKKPSVIVEVKKTPKTVTCTKQEWFIKILFVVLLLLNLVFGILNFMKQDSALDLEEMKVGWSENFSKVMQLYESDFYKEQQSAAIKQFMAQ